MAEISWGGSFGWWMELGNTEDTGNGFTDDPTQTTALTQSVIALVLLLLNKHDLLHPISLLLAILGHKSVLPTQHEILHDQLSRPSQALDVRDAIDSLLQVLVEAGFVADGAERSLHGYRVGADKGFGGDGEEVDGVVLLDEVGSGHELAGFM